MADNVGEVLDRLYSTFLLRDLKFIFIGGVILGFFLYAHQIFSLREVTGKEFLVLVIAFVVLSYFLGFMLFHMGVHVLRIPKLGSLIQVYTHTPSATLENQEVEHFVKMDAISSSSVDRQTLRQLERTIFIMEASGALSITALALLVLLLVYCRWKPDVCITGFGLTVIVFVLLFTLLTGILTNRSGARIQDGIVNRLYQKTKSDKSQGDS